ncbi:MAG TPA: hypothetical protein VMP08_22695 [Anaerolineae bacterium]|nr:hypothetical protein [Anaerolineae bacterium]
MAERTYSRRSFIRVAGLAAGAAILAPVIAQVISGSPIAYADALGKKYKGTRDGRVFESIDDGKTWQQVANFGSHCAVLGLSEQRSRLQAKIGVSGYDFALISTDARLWRTV